MCGNIKKLRFPDRRATTDEIEKASRQYVRKVANYSSPSPENLAVFERAIYDISRSARKLLDSLESG
jgi:hypothetical protein